MQKVVSWWMVFFWVLPFMPIYFLKISYILPLVYLWRLLVVLVVVYIILKLGKLNSFIIFLVVFSLITILTSSLNNNITLGIFYSIITVFGFCALLDYYSKNFQEMIKGLYYLFSSVIILNFILMILYPNGLVLGENYNPIHLLGAKNGIQMVVLPAMTIILIYSYCFYNKLKMFPLLLLLLSLTTLFITSSGTAIVILILVSIFLITYKKYTFSIKTYLLVYISLYFSIVIFRLQEVLFGNFIVNVLEKDITFTGRTHVWDIVLYYLKYSWIIGYGRGNNIIFTETSYLNEAHNGFLEILLSSGVIGLLSFIIILYIVGKKLSKYKKNISSKILTFSIFAYMVIGLTESVFNRIEFWLLLVIAYNVDWIIKKGVNEHHINKED